MVRWLTPRSVCVWCVFAPQLVVVSRDVVVELELWRGGTNSNYYNEPMRKAMLGYAARFARQCQARVRQLREAAISQIPNSCCRQTRFVHRQHQQRELRRKSPSHVKDSRHEVCGGEASALWSRAPCSCCYRSSAARAPSDVRGGSSNRRSCSCAGAAFRGGWCWCWRGLGSPQR